MPHPEVFAHKTVGQIAGHFGDVIGRLTKKPAIVGHSFGGLLTQTLAGRGHSLVIDQGWREVADTALAFMQRFAQSRS